VHSLAPLLTDNFAAGDQEADDERTTDRIRRRIAVDGFSPVPFPLLKEETCHALRGCYEEMFSGNFETGVYPDEWHWRPGLSLPHVTREICNGWKSNRSLVAAIVLHQQLARFVARVMQWNSVRVAQDDLIWKPPAASVKDELQSHPRGTTIGYHRDSEYISKQFVPSEENSVTLWIALDDATEETGCLRYVSQSHLSNDGNGTNSSAEPSSFFEQPEQQQCPESAVASDGGGGEDEVGVVIQPCRTGYGILHHQDVLHGSGPNRSPDRHRRALVIHYLRGDVRWASSSEAAPTTYIYGRYRIYGSDDVEESFFPILYVDASSAGKRTAWIDSYTVSGN